VVIAVLLSPAPQPVPVTLNLTCEAAAAEEMLSALLVKVNGSPASISLLVTTNPSGAADCEKMIVLAADIANL
jgi:hypothetical protein